MPAAYVQPSTTRLQLIRSTYSSTRSLLLKFLKRTGPATAAKIPIRTQVIIGYGQAKLWHRDSGISRRSYARRVCQLPEQFDRVLPATAVASAGSPRNKRTLCAWRAAASFVPAGWRGSRGRRALKSDRSPPRELTTNKRNPRKRRQVRSD